MNYSEKMKDLRFDYEVKQDTIAKHLGIAKSTYSTYEQEYAPMPLKYLIKFCDYFECSLDYIFGLNENIKTLPSYDYSLKKIGSSFRNKRRNLKITCKDFCSYARISPSTLSRYEKGKLLISTNVLYLFCKKYNVSADEILGRKKDQ